MIKMLLKDVLCVAFQDSQMILSVYENMYEKR